MQPQSHQGIIHHNDLIGHPWGTTVESHLGREFGCFPTLRDILLLIARRSQIISPKDIGYILLRLSAGPGTRILEAGTGSGALTTALAWTVGPLAMWFPMTVGAICKTWRGKLWTTPACWIA